MVRIRGRESIGKRLVLGISGVLCVAYLLVFVTLTGINYGLTLRSEEQSNRTYLRNTLMTIDGKIKDMSRVSLMTMADDRTLDIICGYREMTSSQRLSANRYLRGFYTSLSIIRNDICGIYILDTEDMIFHFDDADSAPRRDADALPIPAQIASMVQEPMLVDNCRIIIDAQPSFMRFNGEYVSNPYYATCLWMVRDVYTFSPHVKVGGIVLTAPVERLNDICADTLSEDCFYLLTTQAGKVICSQRTDELLGNTSLLLDKIIGEGESEPIRYNGYRYYATCLSSSESGIRLVVGRRTRTIWHEVFRFVPMYFLFCLATLIVVILVTSAQVHRVVAPVTHLADTMDRFSTDALNERLPVVSGDETGRLIGAYNTMLDTIQNQIEREYRDQARLQAARMREQRLTMLYLKSQVNPHFLYNTLDTIRISAQMNDDPQVADMLMRLVAFFRLSIRFNQSVVSMEHELDLIENYLALMRYRYPELESSIACEPGLEDVELPNFILQPVVENSILHGLRDKGYRGSIDIDVRSVSTGHIELRVSDNGVGLSEDAKRRIDAMLSDEDQETGNDEEIGLKNVQHRLRIFYDDTCGLRYSENPGGGITACILIRRQITRPEEGAEDNPCEI